MAWSDKGNVLAVGTSTGSIQLYAVRQEIAEAAGEPLFCAALLYLLVFLFFCFFGLFVWVVFFVCVLVI